MNNLPEKPKALDRPLVKSDPPPGIRVVDVNDALKKAKQAVEKGETK